MSACHHVCEAPVANVPQKAIHKGRLSGVHSADHIEPFGILTKEASSSQVDLIEADEGLMPDAVLWLQMMPANSNSRGPFL